MLSRKPDGKYAHRHNADGTYDTICLTCFRTVACARVEEDLTAAEQSHTCDPMDLVDIGKVLPFDMRRESGMAERLLPGFVWRKSS